MPTLTVFTPTYNRAYCLGNCYESLKRQSCKDFIWLIIDDGSTDNTRDLVSSWIKEKVVPIRYYQQENQGMHGAHNTAYELIDTELNVCIDSDDYMPDDAVEKIILFWKQYGSSKVSGIIGLDATVDGKVLGTRMPSVVKQATLGEIYSKYNGKGDKKLVYRTELTRKYPYPLFKGERLVPLSYKYSMLDLEYPMLLMDEVLCIVQYMPDGSTNNIIKQYRNNPNGFSFFRKAMMKISKRPVYRFRQAIHYVATSIIARNKLFIHESPCKLITMMALIPGLLLFLYVTNTRRVALKR